MDPGDWKKPVIMPIANSEGQQLRMEWSTLIITKRTGKRYYEMV